MVAMNQTMPPMEPDSAVGMEEGGEGEILPRQFFACVGASVNSSAVSTLEPATPTPNPRIGVGVYNIGACNVGWEVNDDEVN